MSKNDSFILQLEALKEELGKNSPSLPDDAQALFKKIATSFPKLKDVLKMTSAKIIHDHIILLKCEEVNVYIARSKREYSKVDIMAKKGGVNLGKKEGVFFEDIQRTVISLLKPKLNEYEVGDLDRMKSSGSTNDKTSDKKQKIGTNSAVISGVAKSMSSAMDSVSGYPDMERDIIDKASDKFEDMDRVINTGKFRSEVGNSKTYSKIKKSFEDNKKKQNK